MRGVKRLGSEADRARHNKLLQDLCRMTEQWCVGWPWHQLIYHDGICVKNTRRRGVSILLFESTRPVGGVFYDYVSGVNKLGLECPVLQRWSPQNLSAEAA